MFFKIIHDQNQAFNHHNELIFMSFKSESNNFIELTKDDYLIFGYLIDKHQNKLILLSFHSTIINDQYSLKLTFFEDLKYLSNLIIIKSLCI